MFCSCVSDNSWKGYVRLHDQVKPDIMLPFFYVKYGVYIMVVITYNALPFFCVEYGAYIMAVVTCNW